MPGSVGGIEELAGEKDGFSRIVYSGYELQLALMVVGPGQQTGEREHPGREQFMRIESGTGEIWVDGVRNKVGRDDSVIVPEGTRHNVVCTGNAPLRLYTTYALPEHRNRTVHAASLTARPRTSNSTTYRQ